MINPDRATLDFLNRFSDDSKQLGEQWHKEGRVKQIFGNHLLIRGRVETPGGVLLETSLALKGDVWQGDSDTPEGEDCAGLYATMLERLERGRNLPESPNEVGDVPMPVLLEQRHGRELTDSEEAYLGKLEKRYRKFAVDGAVYDHDLIRLEPRWEVTGYDALELWPSPPEDIQGFWNYIAYAFDKRGFGFPKFMEPVTDLEHTGSMLESWEREREVAEWSERIGRFASESAEPPVTASGDLRMLITTNEARLQWRDGEGESFVALDTPAILELVEKDDAGLLELDAGSDFLWTSYLHYRGKAGSEEMRLESDLAARFLNELFGRETLAPLLVTLDDEPFDRAGGELSWRCIPRGGGWELQLMMADGEAVPHALRLLPGEPNLYLSDEAVFPGPPAWLDGERRSPPRTVRLVEEHLEFSQRRDVPNPLELDHIPASARVVDEEGHVVRIQVQRLNPDRGLGTRRNEAPGCHQQGSTSGIHRYCVASNRIWLRSGSRSSGATSVITW